MDEAALGKVEESRDWIRSAGQALGDVYRSRNGVGCAVAEWYLVQALEHIAMALGYLMIGVQHAKDHDVPGAEGRSRRKKRAGGATHDAQGEAGAQEA